MYITISCMRLQEKPGIKAREKQSSVRSFKISKSSLGIKARGDVLDELQQSFSRASAKLQQSLVWTKPRHIVRRLRVA